MTSRLGALGLDTAIPEGLRALAESTVDQTREAYHRSADAFDASVATFEKSFDAAGQGAAAFNRKIIDIARRNLDSSFDLAKSLAGAKNLSEMVELQTAFWRKQFGTLTAQAEEVRELSTKVTADAAEALKAHMANGARALQLSARIECSLSLLPTFGGGLVFMTTRTTEKIITFHRPFCLEGVDRRVAACRLSGGDRRGGHRGARLRGLPSGCDQHLRTGAIWVRSRPRANRSLDLQAAQERDAPMCNAEPATALKP